MNTPFSPELSATRDSYDTEPLSWVMGEIREALARSRAALYDAVSKDAESQSTLLRHAKTYLHQAHGALQVVDIGGVAVIAQAVEDFLERAASGQLRQFGLSTKAISDCRTVAGLFPSTAHATE